MPARDPGRGHGSVRVPEVDHRLPGRSLVTRSPIRAASASLARTACHDGARAGVCASHARVDFQAGEGKRGGRRMSAARCKARGPADSSITRERAVAAQPGDDAHQASISVGFVTAPAGAAGADGRSEHCMPWQPRGAWGIENGCDRPTASAAWSRVASSMKVGRRAGAGPRPAVTRCEQPARASEGATTIHAASAKSTPAGTRTDRALKELLLTRCFPQREQRQGGICDRSTENPYRFENVRER